jgi:integrase
VIYKRGCNSKGVNETCRKCGDRGACGMYWYKFMWQGKLVRESTKQGNDKVARQMEAAHRTSLVGIREKRIVPTLAEFAQLRLVPWAETTFASKPKTWMWYRNGVRRLLEYAPISELKLDELNGEQIAAYVGYRQTGGLEVSSINRELQVLRRLLRLAVDWGIVEKIAKLRMLSGERHREFVLSRQEEAQYLAAAPEPLASIASVLADTGMRPEECYRLRWDAITRANGRNGTLLVTHGKTAAARRLLPITPRVRTILESQWKSAGKPREGWVWSAPTHSGHVESSSLKKQHKKAQRLSKVPPFVLYSLRHTFLTRLGESGCDAWTLARIAGHISVGISSRYVHPSHDAVLSAMETLGGHNFRHTQEIDNGSNMASKLLTS